MLLPQHKKSHFCTGALWLTKTCQVSCVQTQHINCYLKTHNKPSWKTLVLHIKCQCRGMLDLWQAVWQCYGRNKLNPWILSPSKHQNYYPICLKVEKRLCQKSTFLRNGSKHNVALYSNSGAITQKTVIQKGQGQHQDQPTCWTRCSSAISECAKEIWFLHMLVWSCATIEQRTVNVTLQYWLW